MVIELNKKIPGTTNFKWHEFLYLPQWQIHAFPADSEVKQNLMRTAYALQQIRSMFGAPIRITSGYRPPVYNIMIGGARYSHHRTGSAVDFVVAGYEGPKGCEFVRKKIVAEMDRFRIRVERHRGNWLHTDLAWSRDGNNYFNP